MTYRGYDVLALNDLFEKKAVLGLGGCIGTGKESDIFSAIGLKDKLGILKVYRLGKADFRRTRAKRQFLARKHHPSSLYQSQLSAQREFKALTLLYSKGLSVPKPFDSNRHIIFMEGISGRELFRIRKKEQKWYESIFKHIIIQLELMNKLKVIHGDLSEYNIMIEDESNRPVIIDWAQFVSYNHPNSIYLLKRDIKKITDFFIRIGKVGKQKIELSLEDIAFPFDLNTIFE